MLRLLNDFVAVYRLKAKRVLEVGCGRGHYQDVAAGVRAFLHKPFVCASVERLPFADEAFEAVWSVHVLEHVPGLEAALGEVARVLRPWRDFTWRGKLGAVRRGPRPMHHGRLRPNYEVFWQSDSDACNSIDPHDLVCWFASRGWRVVGRETLPRRLLVRGGAVVVQKPGAVDRPSNPLETPFSCTT